MSGSKSVKASSFITHEDDNNDLIDEVSAFHAKDREVNTNKLYKKKISNGPEQILGVDPDQSDTSEDDDDGSDFDDDEVNDITDNKWGKNRKDFYNTDYVDDDWGGMREEEEEQAALEEEDALNRQKQLDSSTAAIADFFDEEDDEGDDDDENVEVDTAVEFNEVNARKKNKKTAKLVKEWAVRKRLFDVVIKPLEQVIKCMPSCALRTQIVYIAQTYASYLMNASFVLKLRAQQFMKKKLEDPLTDIHPSVESLKRITKRLVECENFLHLYSDQLDELKKWSTSQPEKIEELCCKIGDISFKRNKEDNKMEPSNIKSETKQEEKTLLNFTPMDENERRKAKDTIATNRVYQDKKGKKKAKISKTKNRKKVHEIQKRVKSQIGNVRREISKYSGEASGIRASTIKSTKLVA